MFWTKIALNAVIGTGILFVLIYLVKRVAKKIRERERREMSRGGILTLSVLIEILLFTTVCVLPWFLPIWGFWKVLITVAGIAITMLSAFLIIYFWWAPNNLFFTFVKEGTAKIVVKGHKFYKALIQFKGYRLDDPKTTVEVVSGPDKKHWFGGLRFYGLWPLVDIFVYPFRWMGITETGELEPHETEWLDYIFVKDDIYGCEVKNAEDKELIPLNITLTLTARIVNPYKALFAIENWYETLINRIRPYIRDFLTTKTYAKLIAQSKRIGIDISARLEKEKILDELRDDYGIDVEKIEVNALNPKEEFRQATMEKVLALRKKEAIIVTAEAEKEKLTIEAEGQENRIKTEYGAVESFGELGREIRRLEALEKSPGEGAKWVIPADIGSLLSAGKKIIGG